MALLDARRSGRLCQRVVTADRASAAPNPTWPSAWPGSACRAPGSAASATTRSAPWSPGRSGPRVSGSSLRGIPAPTGLMVKEHRGGPPWRVRYYRSGSAASRLSPADLDEPPSRAIAGARGAAPDRNHPGARPGTAAPRSSVPSRSPGLRGLWCRSTSTTARRSGPTTRRTVLARLAAAADLVFAGPEEAALRARRDGRLRRRSRTARLGPRAGQTGPVHRRGQTRRPRRPRPRRRRNHRAPARPVTVVDPVGAGDAFVAGYLSELVANAVVPMSADGQHPRRRRLRVTAATGKAYPPGKNSRTNSTAEDVVR